MRNLPLLANHCTSCAEFSSPPLGSTLSPPPSMLKLRISMPIDYISFDSEDYPEPLRAIPDPPRGLYIIGDKALLKQRQIAMVGSRKCTQAALALSKQWATELASYDIVVTSGMALGIDAAAHAGALSTGKTLAVMGCGLNYVYPKQNATLIKTMIAKGGAISCANIHPDTAARTQYFPSAIVLLVV